MSDDAVVRKFGSIGATPRKLRQSLSVSVTANGRGGETVVSRYRDDVWELWPDFPAAGFPPSRKRIDWGIALPDGTTLLDPRHADLLESAKAFAYALWKDPPQGRKRMKAITVQRVVSVDLVHLLRWMVDRGYRSFREIDGFDDFVEYAKSGQDKDRVPGDGTVALRLRIPEYLWRYGERLEDRIEERPWSEENYNTLAGLPRGGSVNPKTAFIPDSVAKEMARGAVRYVDHLAPGIMEALEVSTAAGRAARERGLSRCRVDELVSEAAKRFGYSGVGDLHTKAGNLRTACLFVAIFFTGIRISEALSLEENCVETEPTPDGQTLVWIHGTKYKMEDDPKGKPERWLVPPVVARSLAVMNRLTGRRREAIRKEMEDLESCVAGKVRGLKGLIAIAKRIDDLRSWNGKLFLSLDGDKTEGVVTERDMCTYLNRFAEELGVRGEGGKPWRFCSHQCRRTFARFAAKNRLGDLHYLRDHFKHWSIRQTAFYAKGAYDRDLLRSVDRNLNGLIGLMRSKWGKKGVQLAGGAGKWIEGFRESGTVFRNGGGTPTRLPEGVRVTGSGHSWCLAVAGKGCGGDCLVEKIDCVDCPMAVIDKSHGDVWRFLARQQERVLECPDVGEPARRRAERFLKKAMEVLGRLEA